MMTVNDLASVLITAGVIVHGPASGAKVFLDSPPDVEALNSQLEIYGWIVQGGQLQIRLATDPTEGPDDVGVALSPRSSVVRPTYQVTIEFWRFGAGASGGRDVAAVSFDGQMVRLAYSVAPGVIFDVDSVTERGYTEGVVFEGQVGGQRLDTSRATVTAGVALRGMLGLMGDYSRLTALLEVSSFDGDTLNRRAVRVPMRVDVAVGEWVQVAMLDGLDASAAAALSGALEWRVRAGIDRIFVRARVDPVTLIAPATPVLSAPKTSDGG